MGEQRRVFDNIGSKLISVSSKFPVVNGVMNAIRRKKNKVGPRDNTYRLAAYPKDKTQIILSLFRNAI